MMQLAARKRPRRTNWRQEALQVSTILMTACWLAVWLAFTVGWFLQITLSAAIGLTIVHLLGAVGLTRWMIHRRVAPGRRAAVVLGGMILAAGLTVVALPALVEVYGGGESITARDLFFIDAEQHVPAGPIVVIWVLFLWWRAYQLGSAYLTLVRASFGMRLGMLSLLGVAIFASDALREEILAVVPFFFFFGLVSTSLGRADSLGLDRGRGRRAGGRGWIAFAVANALAITVVGYVAALWLVGVDTGAIGAVLRTLLDGVITIVFLVATPFLFVARFLLDLFPKSYSVPVERGSGEASTSGGINAPGLTDALTVLGNGALIVIAALLLFAVLAFIWFLFVARGERQDYEDNEREALGTSEVVGGFGQSLRDGWKRLLDTLAALRQFGVGPDLFAALTVRRLYARMERLAGRRGYPRARSETPLEYLGPLGAAFPGGKQAAETVTQAYIAVRYGEVPETREALQTVRDAWERLQQTPDPAKTP